MKLMFCSSCHDVFKLDYEERSCKCGEVKGQYINNRDAVTNGEGVCLAIGNGSLYNAVIHMCKQGDDKDRDFYKDNCRVMYCWVRPHEGSGNPHSSVAQ